MTRNGDHSGRALGDTQKLSTRQNGLYGLRGGLRTVVSKAEPHQRAGGISIVYVISYMSLGLPAILAGTLVVHSSLPQVAEELGAGVIVLATLTAAGLVRSLRREARAVPNPAFPAVS